MAHPLGEKVLVTGVAGFIGSHVAERLLEREISVVGVDCLSDYGGVQLKRDRLARLRGRPGFHFEHLDLSDGEATRRLFATLPGVPVVHLAAQPGVRHSLTHPEAFIQSNLVAFANVLEGCRQARASHLVFASSSSVYGGNPRLPYSTSDNVDHPLSLYAATKKSNELMAHAYAHLHGLPCTGLRFFTVYGPWGRPDMAPYLFTRAILAGEPLQVFHQGQAQRDFTYVSDIVEGLVRVLARPPTLDPSWPREELDPARSFAPYRIYNIGNSQPVKLLHFIETLERVLGRTAHKELQPGRPEDMVATYADVSALERDVGFRPATPLEVGLRRFVEWYRDYHRC